MRLSIITINYNGSESTLKLLKSLTDQTDKDFQTIVVDNASGEDDFNNLRLGVESAILIRNDKNLGFSGGNNMGIRKALAEGANPARGGVNWVVLLNNDTWLESDFINTLGAKLEGLEGIVGIPLIEEDHTAYYGKIEWLKPTLKHGYTPPYSEYLRRNRNFYAIGGAMAIHKDVFDKIGLLDENYFLYFEDADFNIRAKKAGISVSFIDEPKVHHQEVSKTTKKLGSPMLLRYHYRNALYFNRKNGPENIKILLWPWSVGVIVKQLVKILFFYKVPQSLAILLGVIDFYRNKLGQVVNFSDAQKLNAEGH